MDSIRAYSVSEPRQAWLLARSLLKRALRRRTNQALCLCILVCSLIASSIAVFSQGVQSALDNDIANYLGAPLVIRSNTPFDPEPYLTSPEIHSSAQTASFTTGAISKTQYQSVTLKGVGSNYPLQGELRVSFTGEQKVVKANLLAPNHAWLSDRAMSELDVNVGDSVQLGKRQFLITGQLMFEPDRLTQLQHAMPRIMVSLKGLQASGIETDNQRGEHRLLVSGSDVGLAKLAVAAENEAQLNVLTPTAGNHPFSRIAKRAEKMLNMVVVLTLLMCGGAAAILANDVARRYAVPIAVLRSMGLTQRVVIFSICLQLFALTIFASFFGGALGWLVQPLFAYALQPHLMLTTVPPEASYVFKPLLVSSLAVCCFVLPKFIALGSLSVSVILRGGSLNLMRQYWAIALMALVVIGLLWSSSDNLRLTFLLVLSVAVIVTLSLVLGWGLSKLAAQSHRLMTGPMKVAVRFIGRTPSRYSVQMISTGLVMLALLLTTTLRGSFLDTLQVQMLEIDGNYLFSGIPLDKMSELESILKQESIELKGFHPVVSARLTEINGVRIDEALSHESDTREETRSRVRLSWSSGVPKNNTLVSGSWPGFGENEVSVEAEVMEDLGLIIGDTLTFSTLTASSTTSSIIATIGSVRKYQSGGSRMMFWFVFPEGVLESFDVTAMGGMLVPVERSKAEAMTPILSLLPQIRITDLESQIEGIRGVMVALTRLVNIILFTLLGAGATVILASALVNTRSRDKLVSLIRVFGADKKSCLQMGLVEQLIVALVGCAVGIVSVHAIGSAMFVNVFGLPYAPDWFQALVLSLVFSGCFALVGYLITLDGLKKPPRLGEQ